jgi:hypothetical protein
MKAQKGIINYKIPADNLVTVKIFNLIGEELKILENDIKSAGRHTLTFNAGNLPSGIYIYRIESGSFQTSRKMTVLK